MTVAEFLADRPAWLPEPTHAQAAGASWVLGDWTWATMSDCRDLGIVCTWHIEGGSNGMIRATTHEPLLAVMRRVYGDTIVAAMPRRMRRP